MAVIVRRILRSDIPEESRLVREALCQGLDTVLATDVTERKHGAVTLKQGALGIKHRSLELLDRFLFESLLCWCRINRWKVGAEQVSLLPALKTRHTLVPEPCPLQSGPTQSLLLRVRTSREQLAMGQRGKSGGEEGMPRMREHQELLRPGSVSSDLLMPERIHTSCLTISPWNSFSSRRTASRCGTALWSPIWPRT